MLTLYRHPDENKLCPSPCRSLHMPLRDRVNPKTYQRQNMTEAKAFNVIFRYIVDVLSINNPNFVNLIPLIYLQIT